MVPALMELSVMGRLAVLVERRVAKVRRQEKFKK